MIAQILAHSGIGLLIIGATGSSILKEEKNSNFKRLENQYQLKILM